MGTVKQESKLKRSDKGRNCEWSYKNRNWEGQTRIARSTIRKDSQVRPAERHCICNDEKRGDIAAGRNESQVRPYTQTRKFDGQNRGACERETIGALAMITKNRIYEIQKRSALTR